MSFSDDIRAFAVKVQNNSDQVVRQTVFDIMVSIDGMSPIGNPKLWTSLQPYTSLTTKTGRRRKRPQLMFKRQPPKGYVGGHFRANWQLGIGRLASGIIPGHNHSIALAREKAKLPPKGAAGKVYYYGNNLPYAIALEEGHSKVQAPHGMVGRTAVRFGGIVNEAVAGVNK